MPPISTEPRPGSFARVAAVHRTGLLGGSPEPAFDRLTRLAARLLAAPIALVTLVDDRRQYNASCVGLPADVAARGPLPLSHSLCALVVAAVEPLVVADARLHPVLRAHPALTELGIAAYAGVPLVAADGAVLGTVCVADTAPRTWAADTAAVLDDLARAAVTEIELRAAVRETDRARALAEQERRAERALLDRSPDAIVVTDVAGRVTFWSAGAAAMFGRDEPALLGAPLAALLDARPGEGPGAPAARFARLAREGADGVLGRTVELRAVRADGTNFPVELSLGRWEDGGARRYTAILRDVSARARAEAELAERQARLRLVIEQLPAVLWTTDADLRFTSSQGRALALLGLRPELVTGRTVAEFFGSTDPSFLPVVAHRRALSGQSAAYEMAHGGVVFDTHVEPLVGPDGAITGTVGLAVDVTVRRVLEEQLEHQAFHDPLTGLANRALFRDRVEHALARAARGAGVAVLFLDLDDFKTVNDSLGHPAGDALLDAVAQRLLGATRAGDTVARLGGDEFAVLLEDTASPADAVAAADRVRAALAAPVPLAGREMRVGASLGLAHAHPGEGPAELLRNADVAMYQAKAAGKGRCVVFEPAMHAAVLERLELEADLRQALERAAALPPRAADAAPADALRLVYQPIVDLATGRVVAFEALARWHHPTRGAVPPLTFIAVAEETGLIVPLGRWVLREACRQLRRWDAAVPPGAAPTLGVNLSGRQLEDDGLLADIAAALADAGVAAERLTLEITESVLMRRADALERLQAVKALGVRLAVDDFGTGYSSLSYLHRFPVDVLKIDKTFVDGVGRAGNDGAVARAILALGTALKLRTVAEGVERADQLDGLRALGCDLAQGYLFAEPLDAAAAGAMLGR